MCKAPRARFWDRTTLIRGLSIASLIIPSLLPISIGFAGSVTVVTKAAYPEGPLWRNGKLLYVEYAGPGVRIWDGKEAALFWGKEHCGANGLIAYGSNDLLVACYDSNEIVELDESAHVVRTFSVDSDGKPFIGPNDFAADGHGGVYFSASGVYDLKAPITGRVLHLSADGRRITEVANTIHYSNGLTLSKDGRSLLVAEMLAGRILEFPINADGSLGPRTVWARLRDLAPETPNEDGYNGPDGLKSGSDGNYYIAQNGSGRVLIVSPDRKLVGTIQVPTPYVTNMAFGQDGVKTVYITGAFDQFKPPFPGVVYRWTR